MWNNTYYITKEINSVLAKEILLIVGTQKSETLTIKDNME